MINCQDTALCLLRISADYTQSLAVEGLTSIFSFATKYDLLPDLHSSRFVIVAIFQVELIALCVRYIIINYISEGKLVP